MKIGRIIIGLVLWLGFAMSYPAGDIHGAARKGDLTIPGLCPWLDYDV